MEKSRKAERPGPEQLHALRRVSSVCLWRNHYLPPLSYKRHSSRVRLPRENIWLARLRSRDPHLIRGMAGWSLQNCMQYRRGNSLKIIWLLEKRGMNAGQTKRVGTHYVPRSKSFLSNRCAQVYTEESPKPCSTTEEVEKCSRLSYNYLLQYH